MLYRRYPEKPGWPVGAPGRWFPLFSLASRRCAGDIDPTSQQNRVVMSKGGRMVIPPLKLSFSILFGAGFAVLNDIHPN
jgi:hypothetical protein